VFARRNSTRADLRRLAVARLVSMAGNDASGVAVGFALYQQTRSPQWLSLGLMLTIGTGALLGPLGGKVGDLIDRRRLMIAMELAAGAVFATLAVVHTPVALIGMGMLASAIGTVFGPASGAAIAHIAGDRHLSWANGAIATGSNVGKAVGRLGAGALIALLGAAGVFALDAFTFLVSAWLIGSVRRAFSAPLTRPEPGAEAPKEGGLRTILQSETLRPVVAAACVGSFATSFTMTAEVPLVFDLGAGAIGLGALTACWAAGMLAGSWYAGRTMHRANEVTGVLAGRLLMAAGIGLIAAAPSLHPMLACYLLGGFGGGFMGVASQSLIMRSVPDHLRARTQGAIEGGRNLAFGLGVIGAGTAVSVAGARPVYALVGVVMALGSTPVAMLVRRSRVVEDYERPASPPSPLPAPVPASSAPASARLMPSAVATGSAAATILKTPTLGPTAARTPVISSTDAPASSAAVTWSRYEDSSPPMPISAARFTSENVFASRSDMSTASAMRIATTSAIAESSLSEMCCS
jgi:MFS family permease